MASTDFEALHQGLVKKGFHVGDTHFHDCVNEKCKARAVKIYMLSGNKPGGRDIEVCQACGHARSWSRRGITETREEDLPFDLKKYLGMPSS